MTLFVADIASHQDGVTIRQLRDAGMAAVIIKATEGRTYRTPQFAGWVAEARGLSFPFAAYHFTRIGNYAEQAANIASVVPADCPVWLDIEPYQANGVWYRPTAADGYGVEAELTKLGRRVAGQYHWGRPAHGGWWRAAYLSDPHGSAADVYRRQGGDTAAEWAHGEDLWQFCQHGQVAGYSGEVDFSAFRGTLAQLLGHGWFWMPAQPKPPTPVPVPVSDPTGGPDMLVWAKSASTTVGATGQPLIKAGDVFHCAVDATLGGVRWHIPGSAKPLTVAADAAGMLLHADGQDIHEAYPTEIKVGPIVHPA